MCYGLVETMHKGGIADAMDHGTSVSIADESVKHLQEVPFY